MPATYNKPFWQDEEFAIKVADNILDPLQFNDKEFKQYMLWRLGVAHKPTPVEKLLLQLDALEKAELLLTTNLNTTNTKDK